MHVRMASVHLHAPPILMRTTIPAKQMMRAIAERIPETVFKSFRDTQLAHASKKNAAQIPALTDIISTVLPITASWTPTIAAAPHALPALHTTYVQKACARHSVKHRSPNATTNVTTTQMTSITAADAARHARQTM